MCVLCQSLYRVSVHPSTWYILRVTARNAAGSSDCFLKFQTARHDSRSATHVPRHVIVRYQPPFYARIDVVVPFCGVVVSVVLITVAVCICWRRRRERLAALVCSLVAKTRDEI